MAKRRSRQNPIPLIIEPHPADYTGYPFITLIQYRDEHILSIVDNADEKLIKAFVLDRCGPERIDEESIIRVADDWYEYHRSEYPLSFEFSRLSMSGVTSRIYKRFNMEFVTRVIGPLYKFPMDKVESTKRRRKKKIPSGMNVIKLTRF